MTRTRWVGLAALVVLSGCGGSGTSGAQKATAAWTGAENGGGEIVCAACKATGGGVVFVNGIRKTFGLNAIPESGPGHDGQGTAAKGHITLQVHREGAPVETIFGRVDTILECTHDAVATATFAGELRSGGRFEVVVTDAGEPGRADTIAFTSDVLTFDAVELAHGNIQVGHFRGCPCPDGGAKCGCEHDACGCPRDGNEQCGCDQDEWIEDGHDDACADECGCSTPPPPCTEPVTPPPTDTTPPPPPPPTNPPGTPLPL